MRIRWHSIGITAEQAAMVLHVLRKEDDDWVKKCIEYEVEGPRPRGRPKRTWTEVVEKDCQARKLNKEDAVDCSKWRKGCLMIRMVVSGWMFLLVPAYPGSPVPKAVKQLCVCVCVCVCARACVRACVGGVFGTFGCMLMSLKCLNNVYSLQWLDTVGHAAERYSAGKTCLNYPDRFCLRRLRQISSKSKK